MAAGADLEAAAVHKKVEAKLCTRSRWLALIIGPVILLYMIARWTEISYMHTVAVSLPYLVAIPIAAGLPHGLPAGFAQYAACFLTMMASADAKFAIDAWNRTDETREVRMMRALVPTSFACGLVWLSLDVLRWRGARWWPGFRLALTVCCNIRLTVVLLLRFALDAPPDSFPPGRLPFGFALCFNLITAPFAAVVLSPACRRFLSERTGLATVVLTLAELPGGGRRGLPELPAELPAGARASASARAGLQLASTPRQMQVRFHAGEPSVISAATRASSGRASIYSKASRASRGSSQGSHGSRVDPLHGGLGSDIHKRTRVPPPLALPGRQRPRVRQRRITMYPEDFAAYSALYATARTERRSPPRAGPAGAARRSDWGPRRGSAGVFDGDMHEHV